MYKALPLVVVLFFLINYGFGGTIEPQASNVTVIIGKMLEISWTVSPASGEIVNSLEVSMLPNTTSKLLLGSNPLVSSYAKTLFGVGRLSATFDGSKYKLMLKNVSYADSVTFQLFTLFINGNNLDSKRSNIQVTVNGSPSLCGTNLKSKYMVNENRTLSLVQVICGHPKPEVKWKVGDNTFSTSSNSSEINTKIRQYEYSFGTRPITRKDCGKDINFNASNALGSQNGTATIYVTFTPSQVLLKKSPYRDNRDCICVMWYKQDTGECDIKYHLKFDENMFFYNITNTDFELCNSTNEKRVTIWASYNGFDGEKVTYNISATPPPTTTTTTNGGDKSNIGLIVGIVGGILFVIIIIIIVVCVLKHKKKNGTGNHSGYAMRMTGEENNYVTDPTHSNGRQPANPDDPEQAIYSELGPGGGRTGPRPALEQSDYAEMKVDAMGYPIDGAKASEPPTYAPVIKPREGAKRRTPSPPRSNVDGARAAGSTEPPTYAPIIKNRSSSRGRSPPPDEDDHEGVIV